MPARQTIIEAQLRDALACGEIIPYFQPLVQIRTGVVVGFEVLARWLHPERGMVSPDEFIPVAEQSGLIGRLTETILLQAFAATSGTRRSFKLSVNISPTQLRDSSLPEQIRRAAEEGDFPLDHLTIEVTESALIDNLELAVPIAKELKQLGVRLALDDFGTGYSSLRHLQALPFDDLKVDGSFVNSMLSSRDSRKIVAAVIGLGQSLKLTTVAEGIENVVQADMLLWLGCELGQGWLYGAPVAASDIPELLATTMPVAGTSHPEAPASELIEGIEQLPSQRLAQHKAIYDGAPVGLCFLDTSLRYVSINERLAEMNGVSVRAHLGRTVAELVKPDVYPKIGPYLLRALRGEAISSVEVRRPVSADGLESVSRLNSYQPARDEAGEVIGISIVVMDITERTRAEEALRETQDHYRYMVELNPHIPWAMDSRGMNTEAGPRWEELTGQTQEQTANDGFLAAFHPDDVAELMPVIQAALLSGDPIDVEVRVRTRQGDWLWMRSRGKSRRGPDGQIVRWYGILEDIDEFKKVKQALREAQAKQGITAL